jgi:hypothetical protein
MKKIQPNAIGLFCGVCMGLSHAVWAAVVALGFAQAFLDWILSLHFIDNPYIIRPFDISTALILVFFTFVVGYAVGWISGQLWNVLAKKK